VIVLGFQGIQGIINIFELNISMNRKIMTRVKKDVDPGVAEEDIVLGPVCGCADVFYLIKATMGVAD